MANIIIAPNKYVQGNNELANLASYVSKLGKKALCLVSGSGLKRNQETLDLSFSKETISVIYEIFNGECCMTEISRIMEICKKMRLT